MIQQMYCSVALKSYSIMRRLYKHDEVSRNGVFEIVKALCGRAGRADRLVAEGRRAESRRESLLAESQDDISMLAAEALASEDVTCLMYRGRLYYHHHGIRGPDQEEVGTRPEEATVRRSEAPLLACGGSPGRRPDSENAAELLATRKGPVSLPSEQQVYGMLDVPEGRDSNRGGLCWLS